jgi:hypothetical protein
VEFASLVPLFEQAVKIKLRLKAPNTQTFILKLILF